MKKDIKIISDKIRIAGPKVDGGFTVSLDVGQHGQLDVAKLLAIPQNATCEWVLREIKDGKKTNPEDEE